MKRKIALVTGGYSQEAAVSLKSAARVEKAIDSTLFEVYCIHIEKEKWYYKDPKGTEYQINKNDFSLPLPQGSLHFDLVFPVLHGDPGENGKLQAYFDMLSIPYTSSGFYTMVLTFNKAYCNASVRESGIVPVAHSVHLYKNQKAQTQALLEKISFPCFVKPNSGGSSIGISKVNTSAGLDKAMKKAFAEDDEILIEDYIRGRELTCGVMHTKERKIRFPVTEIIPKGKDFFDYEAKYLGFSQEITPAAIPQTLSDRIQECSSQLYDFLNCKGVVRIDYIYREEDDKLYFLEINTLPGQSEQSLIPQQAQAIGMSTTELYSLMIEDALSN